jgi:hypothetical protein
LCRTSSAFASIDPLDRLGGWPFPHEGTQYAYCAPNLKTTARRAALATGYDGGNMRIMLKGESRLNEDLYLVDGTFEVF